MKLKNSRRFSKKRFTKVTIIYFLLFFVIFLLIDYYANMFFSFKLISLTSVTIAFFVGYFHTKYENRDHIDDVADELL